MMRYISFLLMVLLLGIGGTSTAAFSPAQDAQDDVLAAEAAAREAARLAAEAEARRQEEERTMQMIRDGQNSLQDFLRSGDRGGGRPLSAEQTRNRAYAELKAATAELVNVSRQLNEAVLKGSPDVASVDVFENIDKIEKLLKEVKSKAKGR